MNCLVLSIRIIISLVSIIISSVIFTINSIFLKPSDHGSDHGLGWKFVGELCLIYLSISVYQNVFSLQVRFQMPAHVRLKISVHGLFEQMTWPSIKGITYYEFIYWRYFNETTFTYVIAPSECIGLYSNKFSPNKLHTFSSSFVSNGFMKMSWIDMNNEIQNVCNHYFKLIVFMSEWLVSSRQGKDTFQTYRIQVVGLKFGFGFRLNVVILKVFV